MALPPPPIPRRIEAPCPYSPSRTLRFGFLAYVVVTKATVGDSPSLTNHPPAQVDPVKAASRHDAPVSVSAHWLAMDDPLPRALVKHFGSMLPARPSPPATTDARLPEFRSVNCVQADHYTVDFKRITVDHNRPPADQGGDRRSRPGHAGAGKADSNTQAGQAPHASACANCRPGRVADVQGVAAALLTANWSAASPIPGLAPPGAPSRSAFRTPTTTKPNPRRSTM